MHCQLIHVSTLSWLLFLAIVPVLLFVVSIVTLDSFPNYAPMLSSGFSHPDHYPGDDPRDHDQKILLQAAKIL